MATDKCCFSASVSQFISDKLVYRLVMLVGNSTVWNMVSSQTVRCLLTRQLEVGSNILTPTPTACLIVPCCLRRIIYLLYKSLRGTTPIRSALQISSISKLGCTTLIIEISLSWIQGCLPFWIRKCLTDGLCWLRFRGSIAALWLLKEKPWNFDQKYR